jgi:opacity protein-like surface antigen
MRRSGLALGGLYAVTTALTSSAVLAQDGGVRLVFGLENRLEIARNSDLSVPAGGTEVINATVLSFGLTTETAIDRLDFEVSGALIAENAADSGGTDLDFGREVATLTYHREVPAAVLDISGQYRSDDLDGFTDDLTTVDDSGSRTDLSLSARLEVGRTSSIGFAIGVGYESTDYQDALDPDLDDTKTRRADVAMILHASEVTTGRIGLRYSLREDENPGTRRIETLTTYAGLDAALSDRLDLTAEVGYSDSEDEDFDLIDRVRGPDLRFGLTYDMPVGTATALFTVTTDADEGQRETFEIGRDMELPASTISARLGVTHADTTGSDLIGTLNWIRPLPDGAVGLNLARRVSFDTDADEGVTYSSIGLNWAKTVSDLSSISMDITYELSDAPSERIEQVTLGAGYNYRLTEDWSLDSGVGYRVRRDEDGRSESPNLFVAIRRDFELRP